MTTTTAEAQIRFRFRDSVQRGPRSVSIFESTLLCLYPSMTCMINDLPRSHKLAYRGSRIRACFLVCFICPIVQLPEAAV